MMNGSVSFLPDRRRSIADEIRDAIEGDVTPTILAQAIARAERLQSHGIRRDAILRRITAWALDAGKPPGDAA